MQELIVGPWKIQADPEVTRLAYQQIAKGGSEECNCTGCQNFVLVRSSAYPDAVRHLFEQLGIDLSKEVEAYEMGHDAGGHAYGGWFHFAGTTQESPLTADDTQYGPFKYSGGMLTVPGTRFRFYFHNKPALISPAFKEHPVAQLEFEANLPWVIARPEP